MGIEAPWTSDTPKIGAMGARQGLGNKRDSSPGAGSMGRETQG